MLARNQVFNFDRNEQRFLDRFEVCVRHRPGLDFHIFPRRTTFGGIDLRITDGRTAQRARVFVKGQSPVTYRAVTGNTALGRLLRHYLQQAVGATRLDETTSRRTGRFLSLICSVGA